MLVKSFREDLLSSFQLLFSLNFQTLFHYSWWRTFLSLSVKRKYLFVFLQRGDLMLINLVSEIKRRGESYVTWEWGGMKIGNVEKEEKRDGWDGLTNLPASLLCKFMMKRRSLPLSAESMNWRANLTPKSMLSEHPPHSQSMPFGRRLFR